MNHTPNWRHLFVSRDKEMGWLQSAWREAKRGNPQFRVLLGESGLGKTRLAQEFYRWMSREEDPPTESAPEGYWPDAFGTEKSADAVNPAFPDHPEGSAPPIPWLWWGLRWPDPGDTHQTSTGCALIDYWVYLRPHFRPIEIARELHEVRKDAVIKMAGVAASIIESLSGLGGILAARDAYTTITEDRAKERQLLKEREASAAHHAAADLRDLETKVLDTFQLILDPAKSKAKRPNVPAVLFLDDAQWADPDTLRFVSKLLVAARKGHWPLLVIATHWEFEWRKNVSDDISSVENPTQLADLPGLLDPAAEWAEVHVVDVVDDLGPLVQAALPGITSAQSRLILEKAGGNPRLLEEILLHLLRHPALFEGRELSRPLTPKAEQEIREKSFDYHELVDERFCALETSVQRALGWSSAQGMRFLTKITEAIARRIDPEIDRKRLDCALESAETPHCLIELYGEPGSFNLGEFRQRAFQEVASKNLRLDESELAAVEAVLREFLGAWLRNPADPAMTLDPAERRDALLMSRGVFSSGDPASRSLWAIATARLVELHASEYLWNQAHQLAREFADAAPEGWPVEEVPFWTQFDVIELLIKMKDLHRAKRLAAPLAKQTEDLNPSRERGDNRRLSMAPTLLGDVERALGRRESALSSYVRGLKIRERIVSEFGESPESLRDLSVSLEKVADVENALGRRDSALSSYVRGLKIRERIVSEFGESPESLRDLTASLHRVADVENALGRRESALSSYVRGLKISERIVSEFGESPEALRDLSISLNKVADVENALGRRESALSFYVRGLEISERLVFEFGESPEALRDLMISQFNIAMLADKPEALERLRRAKGLNETILARGWGTPETRAEQDIVENAIRGLEKDGAE